MKSLLLAAFAFTLLGYLATPVETAGAMIIFASAMPAGVRIRRLTTQQLMDKLGIRSRETLRKLEKQPGFPHPVYDAGSPVKFFLEHECDSYIRIQAEVRDRKTQTLEQA